MASIVGVVILYLLGLTVALVALNRQTSLPVTGVLPTATSLPAPTKTWPLIVATAPQPQNDQKPLLFGRNWYLVSFNNVHSIPSVQESYTLFNPDGMLIGYTGCKDFAGAYQANLNQLAISNINLGSGTCPDPGLQQQEDLLMASLRSARSYYVADTALQVASDAGFLNYSLTPAQRPEEILPPLAVIKPLPQVQAGQVIVFDGSTSTGQAPLMAWSWNFGDGQSGSGVIVQHTYLNPGAYTVELTVTDQRIQIGSNTQQILILPPPTQILPPTQAPAPTSLPAPELFPPAAKVSSPGYAYLGAPVMFDASGSRPGSSPIVSYSWSIGDGALQATSPNPVASTIYKRTGRYVVTITIVDANGLTDSDTTNISIDAQLDAQVWTLATINGQPLIPGTAITVQFLQGHLAGFGGCNTYDGKNTATYAGNGSYQVVAERITSTFRSCPADISNQEQAYLAALEQVTSAAIQGNMLTLTYPNGVLVFYLISAP